MNFLCLALSDTISTPNPLSQCKGESPGLIIQSELKTRRQRVSKLNSLSNKSRGYHRNLRRASGILNTAKNKLTLTNIVIEEAACYYREALDNDIIRGRSIRALVAASILVACKELNIPRQLKEIAQGVEADALLTGKCYRVLLRQLRLNPPNTDCSIFLSKIAKNSSISDKSYRRAIEILAAVKKNFVSYGKDPNALAAATLYAACIKEGEKVVQSRIAAAGNISVVTLRNRASDVLGAIQ